MAEVWRRRKWVWLSPAKKHSFYVRAWNRNSESDWADVTLNLSNLPTLGWDKGSELRARPIWWNRSIRVRWFPFPVRYRRWFDYYMVFRNDITLSGSRMDDDPSFPANVIASGTAGADSPYFLAKTFENKRKFWEERQVNQLTAWQCFYNDFDIICQSRTEDAHTYEYWVFAYNQKGNPSATSLTDGIVGYLGPDQATWGKPDVPTFKIFRTQVHDINKWGCDVYVKWFCKSGAEYYLIRRKHSAKIFWGLPNRINHEYYGAELDDDGNEINPPEARDPEYQQGVLRNFWVGAPYDFQIKAVNVPGIGPDALESEWSNTSNYTTLTDTDPPAEIENADVRRQYYLLKAKGDYAKLMWSRPNFAIITEQFRHYNVYRLKGTDTQAGLYYLEINKHKGYTNQVPALPAPMPAGEGATPYEELGKFEGTHFIDDNIDETGAGEDVEVFPFIWTCEGANITEQKTAGGIVGTVTRGEFTTDDKHGGSYAFRQQTGIFAAGNIVWYAGAFTFNGDEGFCEFWVKGSWASSPDSYIGSLFYNATNTIYFMLYPTVEATDYYFWIERKAGGKTHRARIPLSEASGLNDMTTNWVRFQCRWSVSGNVMQARVGVGSWYSANTSVISLSAFAANPSYFSMNVKVCPNYLVDDVSLSVSYAVPVVNMAVNYHYWVTAVDVYNYEGPVSMNADKSYAKLSFLPPPVPDIYGHESNLVLSNISYKFYNVRIVWEQIDEAIWYQVKMRIRPPGNKLNGDRKDWSLWHFSTFIDEDRIDRYDDTSSPLPGAVVQTDDQTGSPVYTYPFPVQKDSEIEVYVRAVNNAGPRGREDGWQGAPYTNTISGDTEGPAAVDLFEGECYGIKAPYGPEKWMSVNLRWRPRPVSEAVESYQLRCKDPVSGEWYSLGDAGHRTHVDTSIPLFAAIRQYHSVPGGQLKNSDGELSLTFDIRAVDSDGKESPYPNKECTVTWEAWWVL